MPKPSLRSLLENKGITFDSVMEALHDLTADQAVGKISELSQGAFSPNPVTINSMIQRAIDSGEIQASPLKERESQGQRGKPSLQSLLVKDGHKMADIFAAIDDMTLDDAVAKIKEITKDKHNPSPITVQKMVERAVESGELKANTLKIRTRGNHAEKGEPVDAPPQHSDETFPVTYRCGCGTQRNEKTGVYASHGKHVVLGLLAVRCHGCGKFGGIQANAKIGEILIRKALVEGREEFIDTQGNIIANPFITSKEIANV